MKVYGKLRRKRPIENSLSLSPTKHISVNDSFTSSTTSIPEIPIFSSTSSIDILECDNIREENADKVLETKNNAMDPLSSPVQKCKQKKSDFSMFNFEELEFNYIPEKTDSSTVKKSKKLKNTTFFSEKRIIDEFDKDSENAVFEEDEILHKVSSTINQLNCRLIALESETHKHTTKELEETEFIPVISSFPSSAKTYAQVRSYKYLEKNLSDSDEDEDESGVVNADKNDSIINNNKIGSYQSSVELKLSGELQSFQLEFEMMMDQLEHWIDEKNVNELTQIKLDLISKISTDPKFEKYLNHQIVGKCVRFSKLLLEMLQMSSDYSIINIQLTDFFHYSSWSNQKFGFSISHWIQEIINLDNVSINDFVRNNYVIKNRLHKDMIKDWLNAVKHESSYATIFNMLEKFNTNQFEQLSDNEQAIIALFILKSINSEALFLRSVHLFESVIGIFRCDMTAITVNLYDQLSIANDLTKINNILKCLISLSCNIDKTSKPADIISKNQNTWDKIWKMVEENNIFLYPDLGELSEQNFLFSLGYIFSILDIIDEIKNSVNCSKLKKIINSLPDKNYSDTLHCYCYAYLGCIGYKILDNFGELGDKEKRKISKILKSNKAANNIPALQNQVNDILQAIHILK